MKYIKASRYSYGHKRDRNTIKFIVIHYTGNKGDTAKGNCTYFKNGNTRNAGAHFFIDQKGDAIKSIALNLTAWSVGGDMRSGVAGEGKYYGSCTNSNSVSIELCDCKDKDPSPEMIKAVKKTIRYIRKYCPHAYTIIRHWDVNGKQCPARMCGKSNKRWIKFLKDIGWTA